MDIEGSYNNTQFPFTSCHVERLSNGVSVKRHKFTICRIRIGFKAHANSVCIYTGLAQGCCDKSLALRPYCRLAL
jgi:hypothetical protein